jgi:hypothetical protein
MSYHRFKTPCICFGGFIHPDSCIKCATCRGTTVAEHGSFEAFYMAPGQSGFDPEIFDGPGWYWWACFPGCMPDDDPCGPFLTEDAAIASANEEE